TKSPTKIDGRDITSACWNTAKSNTHADSRTVSALLFEENLFRAAWGDSSETARGHAGRAGRGGGYSRQSDAKSGRIRGRAAPGPHEPASGTRGKSPAPSGRTGEPRGRSESRRACNDS